MTDTTKSQSVDPDVNHNHTTTLCHNISNTFESKEYSDVTFSIEGQQLHCHKIILASQSTYFDAMFKSPLTTSSTIPITTMSYEIFKEIIRFLYTGKIKIEAENEEMLLEVSDMMGLEPLTHTLENHCEQKFDETNCLDYYSLGLKYSAKQLELKAMRYATREFDNVKKTKRFRGHSCDIISSYLGHLSIKTYSEDEICTAAIDWMLHDPKERIPQFYDVVKVIRIETLTPHFMQNYIHELLFNQPKEISSETAELRKKFHDVIWHIWFLYSNPQEISYRFPRTETTVVSGLATVENGCVTWYRYTSTNSLEFQKFTENIFPCYDTCSYYRFKDNILCHTYDRPEQLDEYDHYKNIQKSFDLPSDTTILAHDNEDLFAVGLQVDSMHVIDHHIPFLTVSKYNKYDPNKWIQIFSIPDFQGRILLARPYSKATVFNRRIYVWAVHFQKSNVEEIAFQSILVIDVDKRECKMLNTTLPTNVTGNLQCVEHKRFVIQAVNGKAWKCDMDILEQEYEKLQPVTQFIQDQSEEITSKTEEESAQEQSETENEKIIKAISPIYNLCLNRKNFYMARIGNMLVLAGGEIMHKSSWRTKNKILHMNIDTVIKNKRATRWEVVGKLERGGLSGIFPLTFTQ